MSEKITIFDIEVLNQDPTSVCAIGIVELEGNKMTDSYYSLIKPRNLSFDPYRYKVHKIRPNHLIKERPFKAVWQDIKHFFENRIVVSHDIQGDMMYLREVLKQNKIPYPKLQMSCTNVLAHLVYPNLQKYNVAELSLKIGFVFEAHHALGDALACAHILTEMYKQEDVEGIRQLHEKFDLEFGEMRENYYRNIISAEIAPLLSEMSQKKDSFLYHQSVCFTGKLTIPKEILEEKTKQAAGLPANQVSTQTNYLVIGEKGYQKVRFGKENKKVQKALKLMKLGQDLHIVHENEFLKLLEAKK